MKLEDKYYEYFSKEISDWHKPNKNEIHASMIYDVVMGKITPKDFFERQKPDRIGLHYMNTGSLWHSRIQEIYHQENQEKEIRIPITDDLEIVGKIDLFINNRIAELKTCEKFPIKPYQAHVYQVHCYMEALKKKTAWITYIKVRGSRPLFPEENTTKDFLINFDEMLWRKIVSRTKAFHKELLKWQKV